MLRTCSPYCYAFIIFQLCLVKRFTECMFLGQPKCYRTASYEKVIYFVNRSHVQDESITYTQATCDPREENASCKNWTTDHTSPCSKSNRNKTLHIEMPRYSFIISCPLRQQSNTYYHEARAFRKDSSLGKSETFREISINTCCCNWLDIRPKVTFQLSTTEPISLQLAFDSRVSKIKLYLATNSSLIPICEDKSGPFSKEKVPCTLEKPIGCAEHSLVVRLESLQCINNYEFNITIPKKLERKVEIFEKNFICNRYDDGVEIAPISFDGSHTYFIKNPNNSTQKALLSRRRIKLRGKPGRDIVIKVCKMNCICSQYLTLKNCHIKQTTPKNSQRVLTVTLVLALMLLIAIISFIIIRKKTRNKSTKAEENTLENIFDDSSVGVLTQPYETQLQQNCPTVNATSKHEDETFDQINMPHGNSL